MADLTIKRHDTYPPLVATLSDINGPIDLSQATSVKLIMKGLTVMMVGTCSVLSPATSGSVQYAWAPGDTSVSGTYSVEFEIVWSWGGVQTVPNAGYNSVAIVDDLENV